MHWYAIRKVQLLLCRKINLRFLPIVSPGDVHQVIRWSGCTKVLEFSCTVTSWHCFAIKCNAHTRARARRDMHMHARTPTRALARTSSNMHAFARTHKTWCRLQSYQWILISSVSSITASSSSGRSGGRDRDDTIRRATNASGAVCG